VLRAGTEQGHGVAVVCGAGINCVGVAPDGRHVRFPALGTITGDWGGGYDVGLAAVFKAARSFDGRGAATTLELPPVVFAEAAHDEVAAGIVDQLADEVVALAGTAIGRLALDGSEVEVLLGGGLLQGENSRVVERIRAGLPGVPVHVTGSPPIVGAALLALDELGANGEAQARVRS